MNYCKMLVLLFCLSFLSINATKKTNVIRRPITQLRIVDGQYECPVLNCNYTTDSKSTLAAHRSRQHSNRLYPCPYCDNIYELGDSRRSHIKRKHLDNIKEDESLQEIASNDESEVIESIACEEKREKRERKAKTEAYSTMKVYAEILRGKDKDAIKKRPNKRIKREKQEISEKNTNNDLSNTINSDELIPTSDIKQEQPLLIDPSNYKIKQKDFALILELQKQAEEERSIKAQQEKLGLVYDPTLKNSKLFFLPY